MKFDALFYALFIFAFFVAVPGTGVAEDTAGKFIFNEETYREDLNRPPNMATFNRAIGIITDLLREQRRLFTEKRGAAANEIADKAEEMMNEANLLGSQAQYEGAYALLRASFDMLAASIRELAAENGK